MGLIRVLLALAVVLAHANLDGYLGTSVMAVKMFFAISGFLIAYVLQKDAAYQNVKTFYVNRALRIFPVYWIIAIAALGLWLADDSKSTAFLSLNLPAQSVLVASNIILFGQDTVLFLKQTGTGVGWTRNFRWEDNQLWQYLLVPQAWSLSLELTFYTVAPFLMRKTGWIVGAAAISFALALVGFAAGLISDPWTYRFFPFELSLFLLGALSQRLLLPRVDRGSLLVRVSPFAAAALFCAYPFIPLPDILSSYLCLVAFAGLLPFLFIFQHGRRWDIWIGNLSYPLYISHVLALDLTRHLHVSNPLQVAFGICLAGVFSLLLEYGANRPVEVLRKKIRRKAAPLDVIDEPRASARAAAG